MSRIVFFVIACACVTAVVALARPASASAGWCWPGCSSWGYLGAGTSTQNGCWYASGEVCSYWASWQVNGISKKCYPGCDWFNNTTGMVLYGFENRERIRGRLTVKSDTVYIAPSNVAMSGTLRAQVAWYSGPASLLNAAAIG
ncbi:MAG: hypothetical protein ACJ74D_05525 [Gaiellaceae bacterium]